MSNTKTRPAQPTQQRYQQEVAISAQPTQRCRQQVAIPPPRSPVVGLSASKVQSWHLDRFAFVYIRQSSPQQVLEHRESRLRQYGLVDYAMALGWSADRVQVIDEDQGQSGRDAEHRAGFQRLLAGPVSNSVSSPPAR